MARKTAKADIAKVDSNDLQKVVDIRRTVTISINRIFPNSSNKNRMGGQYMAALKANMANPNIGFTIPILVRPSPEMVQYEEGKTYSPEYLDGLISEPEMKFEIIDGEHRWRAAKEIGYQRVPVVVFPPMPDSLAKFIMLESNQIKGATKDEHIHEILESIYSSSDTWLEQVEDDLHTMLVMDAKADDTDKYGLEDVEVENDRPASTPVTLFFSENQREQFRKSIGALRLANGCTNEEAVIQVIEFFEMNTGFGDHPKEE
jgi:hypothetical protein